MRDTLICPACSAESDSEECPSCGAELTSLWELRAAVYRLADEALRHARNGKIYQAAELADRATGLYLDEELRPLFGWLLFLDGRVGPASHCWEQTPEKARAIIRAYNSALSQARQSSWLQALQTIGQVSIPFRPATLLRFSCAVRLGQEDQAKDLRAQISTAFPDLAVAGVDLSRTVSFRPRRSDHTLNSSRGILKRGLAGLAILLFGGGLGYWRGTSTQRGDNAPSPAQSPPRGVEGGVPATGSVPPERSVADSLKLGWAYLNGQEHSVADAVDTFIADAPPVVIQNIPISVRQSTARAWYLEGLRRSQADRSQEAVAPLKAALVSVGAASGLYWVDDALYLLMRAQEEVGGGESGRNAAEMILKHHGSSIYANSVTRSVAAGGQIQ